METMIMDAIVENNSIRVPRKFNNRRVKVIIIDPDKRSSKEKIVTRKLNFKIDETLEDVVPFSDIKDTKQFAKELRERHWR
jgi:hypothetical protein